LLERLEVSRQFGRQRSGGSFAIDVHCLIAGLQDVELDGLVLDPTELKGMSEGLAWSGARQALRVREPLEEFPRHFVSELETEDCRITVAVMSAGLPRGHCLTPARDDARQVSAH